MTHQTIIVETTKGKIRGIHQNGLSEFRGIPFAEPPVGQRRWLPPEPCQPWDNVLEALTFKSVSPQIRREPGLLQLPGFDVVETQSEDCLFLNIWTTGIDNAKRPVMVWIHGGAFTMGSGSQPAYWGDILAARGNVVIVSLNYRLGILGFLNLNEITSGRIPSTGNEGLLDQIAALQWVHENIQFFGGDPGNVTVFGESSGAMSIGCLLAIPQAKGLFHKAIMESGTGHMARPLSVSVQIAQQFVDRAGTKSDDIQALYSLPVDRILAIQQELATQAPGGITPVAPVIDGRVLPGLPLERVKSGAGLTIPILIGNNLDENKIAYPRQPAVVKMGEAELVRLCRSLLPEKQILPFIEIYKKARVKRGEPVEPHEIYSALRGDVMFRIPAVSLAQAMCSNGRSAYNYLFTWKSPAMGGLLGACHTLEIGFVFGRMNPDFCGSGQPVEKLSLQIQNAWVAFARDGNPSCQSLGEWPPYCDGRKTMLLGPHCHIEELAYEEERQAWDTLGEGHPVL